MTTGKKAPVPTLSNKPVRGDEEPLIDDIRLLGRILGDVIREQEGEATYALVEKVRRRSASAILMLRSADSAALGKVGRRPSQLSAELPVA